MSGRARILMGGVLAALALVGFPSSAAALDVFNAKPLIAVEGNSIDGERVVAFEDAGACNDGAYNITIGWGDGTSSAGQIDRSDDIRPGVCFYDVSGSHTYRTSGTFVLTATVCGPAGCAAPVTAPVTISEADLRGEALTTLQSVAGGQFSGNVAEINDDNRESTAGDFSVTIDWGDGTAPTPGTVTGTGGRLDVSGTHTYAAAGVYRVLVTVTNGGRAVTLDPGTVTVAANAVGAPTPNPGGGPLLATPSLRVLTPRIRLATLRRSGLRLRVGVGGFRNRSMRISLINPANGRALGRATFSVATTTLQGRERVATVRVRFSRAVLNRLRRGRRYGLRIANTGGLGRTLQANVTIR